MTIFVVMGVSGCGKSTLARALAGAMGGLYLDADDFHSSTNKEKMSSGIPLIEEDRWPWLDHLRAGLAREEVSGRPCFLACSALKQRYRDYLGSGFDGLRFIYLKGSLELIRERVARRQDHFMPPQLLESQFTDLEEPLDAIILDASRSVDELMADFQKNILPSRRLVC
jgi:gluconokinase